jgi:hypothetical protein
MISVYEQYRMVWLAARVDRRMRVEKKSKQRSCRTHEENSTTQQKKNQKKKLKRPLLSQHLRARDRRRKADVPTGKSGGGFECGVGRFRGVNCNWRQVSVSYMY